MAITLPHIEDSDSTKYIPPKGEFVLFQDETHYAEKVKEWGLNSSKKEFWFKNKTHQRLVTIKGYENFGVNSENNTIVIEFQDGNLTCIHPAYLKEMQSSNFGKELKVKEEPTDVKEKSNANIVETQVEVVDTPENAVKKTPKAPKKEKAVKIILPEDKVHFTGKVKQFALSWNHFNEENDEVVVLEDVRIDQEEPLEIGLAWCAHSKTLKKLELAPGMELEFDGKIVKKSLPKGKEIEDESMRLDVSVGYKVNNPSKIVKI